MVLFQELLQGMAHLFLPRLCEGCAAPLLPREDVLCLRCFQELPRTDYHLFPDNEAATRLAGRIRYDHVTALCAFTTEGLLQHLLHRLKYGDRQEIGTFLGRQLGHALAESAWAASVDLLLPVPLHPRKEAKRGYNQSTLIAAGAAAVLGKPCAPKLLQRVRHTISQTQQSREARVANVSGAFRVTDARALSGRHVLLIDDVLTTGATLEAAAQPLLEVEGLRLSLATAGIAGG